MSEAQQHFPFVLFNSSCACFAIEFNHNNWSWFWAAWVPIMHAKKYPILGISRYLIFQDQRVLLTWDFLGIPMYLPLDLECPRIQLNILWFISTSYIEQVVAVLEIVRISDLCMRSMLIICFLLNCLSVATLKFIMAQINLYIYTYIDSFSFYPCTVTITSNIPILSPTTVIVILIAGIVMLINAGMIMLSPTGLYLWKHSN